MKATLAADVTLAAFATLADDGSRKWGATRLWRAGSALALRREREAKEADAAIVVQRMFRVRPRGLGWGERRRGALRQGTLSSTLLVAIWTEGRDAGI